MPSRKLPNYVRAARKTQGLTQRDLAYLIGGVRGSDRLSRYEHFVRTPSLVMALRLQAALGIPVSELFAGLYAEAQRVVEHHRTLRQRPKQCGKIQARASDDDSAAKPYV